jgi:uncharacterized protein YcbX
MSRFRPNLVVETSTPWEEDSWRIIKVRGGRSQNRERSQIASEAR